MNVSNIFHDYIYLVDEMKRRRIRLNEPTVRTRRGGGVVEDVRNDEFFLLGRDDNIVMNSSSAKDI